MPLYRRRIKKSYLSQSSEGIEGEPEVKIKKTSAEFYQANSSQTAIEEISQTNKILRSPIYPEALPRTASEPNESASVEYENFGEEKTDMFTELQSLPSSNPYTLNTESNEQFDIFSSENKFQQIKPHSSENAELGTKIENTKAMRNKKLQNYSKNNESFKEFPSGEVPLKKSQNISKSRNEAKIKSNKLTKQTHSQKRNGNQLHCRNQCENEIVQSNISSETQKISHNSSTHSQEPNMTEKKYGESLNSSSNKNFNASDATISSNKLLNSETQKKSINGNILSQRSDISMSDPVVKNAYMEFMKKKEKYCRVATPKGLKHDQKMLWLQQQRNVGVYVHCDECDKIRYLDNVTDPLVLPDKWYCRNNSDLLHNKCDDEEEKFPLHVQEDWIDNLYNAGSLVWARVEGYPWWPGIVDDDPNTECYYWLDDEFTNTPSYYHVTFFDEKAVSRSWLKPNAIKPFVKEMDNPHYLPGHFCLFKKRIDVAIRQAKEADKMPLLTRLQKFSFVAKYKKPIIKPRDVNLQLNNQISKTTNAIQDAKNRGKSKQKLGEIVKTIPKNNETKKRQNIKHKKKSKYINESNELIFDDFEIPSSPVIDDISLDLFEDV